MSLTRSILPPSGISSASMLPSKEWQPNDAGLNGLNLERKYRILYLGNDWYGSCARACGYALRRAGHEVIDVSLDNWVPLSRRFFTKALLRIARPLLRSEFNAEVLSAARRFQPDMLLTFKGNFVARDTLQSLRGAGLPLYQYYPDNSVFSQNLVDPRTMQEYDCCFFTKKFLLADSSRRLHLRNAVYLPHGYDPDIHAVPDLSEDDYRRFGSDVTAILAHTAGKEHFFHELLSLRPTLRLRIWGQGWKERCKSQLVRTKIEGAPIYGQAYAKALRAAKINLALLIEGTRGASNGDLTTTRSFEIPACGGFMLHKRNPDILELYEEGREIECFENASEALEKIDHYLDHPELREQIAANGHLRATPAYSYDERMRVIMAYHASAFGGTQTSPPHALNSATGAAE
jgi:spore maturation protein CgeB